MMYNDVIPDRRFNLEITDCQSERNTMRERAPVYVPRNHNYVHMCRQFFTYN
ncbi:hypothetical protein PUN28_013303 [Cardiocondyla obscurior]|uniref:Uncharacterized protein n=1 Tax=Cardiocondyla obscurior TaxID=286306 RepID=A0AAW2F926_9HYME